MPTMQPLNYAGPETLRPRRYGWVGWAAFVVLAIVLFLVFSREGGANATTPAIPLSEFQQHYISGEVASVAISGDELRGRFRRPLPISGVPTTVTRFRVVLPQDMGKSWPFIQWLLENRHGAVVNADNRQNLLLNILVPLIPWLLIFGFIWVFVFRSMRAGKTAARTPRPVYIVQMPEQIDSAPPGGST